MKKNITILITGVVLSFCFIILYKGLNNPNTYVPKTSIKKDIPIFNAVDFFSRKTVSSDEIFKDSLFPAPALELPMGKVGLTLLVSQHWIGAGS